MQKLLSLSPKFINEEFIEKNVFLFRNGQNDERTTAPMHGGNKRQEY